MEKWYEMPFDYVVADQARHYSTENLIQIVKTVLSRNSYTLYQGLFFPSVKSSTLLLFVIILVANFILVLRLLKDVANFGIYRVLPIVRYLFSISPIRFFKYAPRNISLSPGISSIPNFFKFFNF